jgi:D-tagatose-1,6-bisphosphate aldolase subunit GatZ/KbaZ
MSNLLDEIVNSQKRGEARGITSICSAHPWVLRTALRGKQPVLIESTCNQVNQFGGYTGMSPADFVQFVHEIAAENDFPTKDLILGGDHLGPSPWQEEPASSAMQKACDLVQSYVQAGFSKIHLDASMILGDDDPTRPLDIKIAAQRTALLAHAAEAGAEGGTDLRYVIGTEVPIPGGATTHEDDVSVTKVEDAQCTLEITRKAFIEAGLDAAWERVMALVVQPGVEFGDDFILDYNKEKASDLACFSEITPLIFEAHSTDYQTPDSLRNLVRDHFAVLKVGPALTYCFREAVFAMAWMESELFPVGERSHLIDTLDTAMQRNPIYWKNYYRGCESEITYSRKYSLSDRSRYYWSEPDVQTALARLIKNLDAVRLPLTLVHQFLPDIYPALREGRGPISATDIIIHRIQHVLEDYHFACGNVVS